MQFGVSLLRWAAVPVAIACGCSEPATSPTTQSPERAHADAGLNEAAPVDTVTDVEITRGEIHWRGHRLVATRPAGAPGVLDDELRPSYALPELQSAARELGDDPASVRVQADAEVASVRNVLASLPASAELVVQGVPHTDTEVRIYAATAASGPRIRWTSKGVELVGAAAPTSVRDLGELAPALAALGDRNALVLELDDTRDASDLLAGLAAIAGVARTAIRVGLAMEHAPCVEPPEGMVCVPGGRVIVGDDEGPPEDRPRRELVLSTFYVDAKEITIAQYDACHAAGVCPRRINGTQTIMAPFVGADQPAMPLDWERAARFCAWAGKRLPTEWEWEKAARGPDGDAYPWGDEPPSCERAQYRECAPMGCRPYPGKAHRWDCNEHATKPVGSYPAGHYGIFDMAGNGYEWTATAGVENVTACGAACSGRDPLGPCDGAFPCREAPTRILKGGSWYWPAGRVRGAHRRLEKLVTGSHRLGARCASSDAFVTTFPPPFLAQRRPALDTPTAPSSDELAIAASVEHDTIAEKPICSDEVRKGWGTLQERGGRSELHCRDPFPYLESNEPRAHLWMRYLADIGGGYVGVGSDQNYSFIAVARPRWAWVMDYDPRVVDHHLRMRAFVRHAETRDDFIALWSATRSSEAIEILEREYAGSPALAKLRRGYHATRERMHAYFLEQRQPIPRWDRARKGAEGELDGVPFGWLRSDASYAYVRAMFVQGRLEVLPGDLLGGKTLAGIGAAARRLGVPIRIYYTSNAPSSWGGQMTEAYRNNVLALPFDRHSLVLQTAGKGAFRQSGHWHYDVEWGRHLQSRLRLPGYDALPKIMFDRIASDHGDLTVLGIPAR